MKAAIEEAHIDESSILSPEQRSRVNDLLARRHRAFSAPATPDGWTAIDVTSHSEGADGAVSASDDGLFPAIKDTGAELHAAPSCWRESPRG